MLRIGVGAAYAKTYACAEARLQHRRMAAGGWERPNGSLPLSKKMALFSKFLRTSSRELRYIEWINLSDV